MMNSYLDRKIKATDFLIWITSIAFCAAGVHYSHTHALQLNPRLVPAMSEEHWAAFLFWGIVIASILFRGTAIAGGVVVGRLHLREERSGNWQPGHLLLVMLGVEGLTAVVVDLTLTFHSEAMGLAAATVHQLVVWGLTPLFFAYCAWRSVVLTWKACFAFYTLVAIAPPLATALLPVFPSLPGHFLTTFLQSSLAILLIVIAIAEYLCRTVRDWLHWLGVGVAIASNGLSLLWEIWRVYS